MFAWTEKRIEWYERALAWTGYPAVLADMLVPFLPEGESVCDLGCGTGYLASELAERGYHVCAVDKSTLALNVLRCKKAAGGLDRLDIMERSWNDIRDEKLWDNVVMVAAGYFDKELVKYISLCAKRLILVVKEDKGSHVLPVGEPSQLRMRNYKVAEFLEGLHYDTTKFSPEFGQPFTSLDEAKEYISYFGGTTEGAESAMNRLVRTGNWEYPYYLPSCFEKLIYVVYREEDERGEK